MVPFLSLSYLIIGWTDPSGVYLAGLSDIKCSGNWMWAAKLPHEGAALYDACKAMSDMMIQLGIAIDGGKDSLRCLVNFQFHSDHPFS